MKNIILKTGEICFVDDEDFEYLNQWSWRAYKSRNKTFYIGRTQRLQNSDKKQTLYIHRDILKLQKGEYGDHINGNTFDNRKSNLRKVTSVQNNYNTKMRKDNTSGFKGVLNKKRGFIANIKVGPKRIYLGIFKNPKDGAIAYDKAAIKYFGEFAKTNKMLGLL